MDINYENKIPNKEDFFLLYETTGWNQTKNFTVEDLGKAIHHSWYFISAYHDGRLVGCGRIISDGIYQTFIGDLIIHPEFQGRGIGSEILQLLIDKCKESGIKWIQLTSAKGKKGFYEKFGFQERPADAPGMEWRG